MPTYATILLLTLFAIHFVVFLLLYFRRRHKPYILLCLTFLFMTISITLRQWAPHVSFGALPVYWAPRIGAWCTSALYLYSRIRRPKSRRSIQ